MQKPISATLHGAIDYSTVAAAAAAPRVLGFSPRATRTALTLAAGYLALSALTDCRPGMRRTVPLRAHGVSDAVMGVALPALPWLLGFARERRARNFFLGLTAVTAVVTALTDWNPRHAR